MQEFSTTVNPLVRHYQPESKNYVVRPIHFQYKTHFGIIIQKNTTFTLQISTTDLIQESYFHCLTTTKKGTFNEESLKNYRNSTLTITTLNDCVPMTSVSQNIPLTLTLRTKNWSHLPVFNSQYLTTLSSKQAEREFYNQVKLYGFVENYYTQMLLSKEDIDVLEKKDYGLYVGLQNQADLIQYYDYLLGSSRYENEDTSSGYLQMERTTMFLRSEPCNEALSFADSKSTKIFLDSCMNLGTTCYRGCAYYAYYSEHWIAITADVSQFLAPKKGEEWVLLHEVGHNYNIAPYNVNIFGFGETGEVWNNVFAAMYQQKYSVKVHWINESLSEGKDTVDNYLKGKPLSSWDWRPKLHFVMSIFGYDGTDSALREFHLRHYQHSERRHKHFNNIVTDILEVFLDLYNVNLFPYMEKVLNVDPIGIPLYSEELKLRLISGNAIMPALDFGLEPQDLQAASRERDFRYSTPLTLLRKVPRKSLSVRFRINSPIILTGICLYLNNDCHQIVEHTFTLQLEANVYSSFIFLNDREDFYLSDVAYHTIVKNMMEIELNVREMKKTVFLPLVHYTVSAFDTNGVLISQAFINYKTMEVSISQLPPENDDEQPGQVTSAPIFQLGSQSHFGDYNNDDDTNDDVYDVYDDYDDDFDDDSDNDDYDDDTDNDDYDDYDDFDDFDDFDDDNDDNDSRKSIESGGYPFLINDSIIMNVENLKLIDINGKKIVVDETVDKYIKFIFTPVGIQSDVNSQDFQYIESEIERIRQFSDNYHIDLSGNELYHEYLARYAKQLQKFNSNIKFPKNWLN